MSETAHAEPIQLITGTYYSRALSRDQYYRYLLPRQPVSQPCHLPVIVMLHGYGSNCEEWVSHTRIAAQLARYELLTIFPQGDNGWYTNSYDGSTRYEDDITECLIPEVIRNLPVATDARSWAIGGMSMGGYGAVKLAIKYPELFGAAFSHAGAFERMMQGDNHPVFGDPDNDFEFRRRESPVWLVEQLMCRFPIVRPSLFLDCGLSDPLLEVNRRFSSHLSFLGYHHTYAEAPGHHTWPYWNRAFRNVLPAIAKTIGAPEIGVL